jgi:DNA-binding MarR family transcriptional regulator
MAESTYADKTSNTEQIDKLEELKKTHENTKDELAIASREVSELEKSVNDKKRETDRLKSDLQSLKKKHDSDIRSLRESHDKAQDELSWKEAQHKALRLLGNEKAATFPEFKVIQALREQSTTTMSHLETATQLKQNQIESILKKLAKKAVIQYDSKAGEVRVLRHLED